MRDIFNLAAVFLVLLIISRGPSSSQAQAQVRKPAAATAPAASSEDSSLWQTQNQLRSPELRKQVIDADPAAANTDKGVRQLMGSEANTAKLYDVSADVLAEVVDMANGDPEKMQDLLNKAKLNPEAFYNALSDTQKLKIRGLANDAAAAKPLNH